MSEIIKVKNLTKKYDGRKVVKGISFSVNEGEVFGILGQNAQFSYEILRKLVVLDQKGFILYGFCQELSFLEANTFLRMNTLYCINQV